MKIIHVNKNLIIRYYNETSKIFIKIRKQTFFFKYLFNLLIIEYSFFPQNL